MFATDWKEEPSSSPPQQNATETDPITLLNRQPKTSSRNVCHVQRSAGRFFGSCIGGLTKKEAGCRPGPANLIHSCQRSVVSDQQ
jgi:hypothetical protein